MRNSNHSNKYYFSGLQAGIEKIVAAHGIVLIEHNGGEHWQFRDKTSNAVVMDFWPSTLRYSARHGDTATVKLCKPDLNSLTEALKQEIRIWKETTSSDSPTFGDRYFPRDIVAEERPSPEPPPPSTTVSKMEKVLSAIADHITTIQTDLAKDSHLSPGVNRMAEELMRLLVTVQAVIQRS